MYCHKWSSLERPPAGRLTEIWVSQRHCATVQLDWRRMRLVGCGAPCTRSTLYVHSTRLFTDVLKVCKAGPLTNLRVIGNEKGSHGSSPGQTPRQFMLQYGLSTALRPRRYSAGGSRGSESRVVRGTCRAFCVRGGPRWILPVPAAELRLIPNGFSPHRRQIPLGASRPAGGLSSLVTRQSGLSPFL